MRTWIYLENPFLNATEGSYDLAVAISSFHKNALESGGNDPFLQPLFTAYEPKHNALTDAYNLWKTIGGSQKGLTEGLDQLLQQTVDKLNLWEPAIQVVFPKTTPEYLAIFPLGRAPFTTGKKENRINAFASLRDGLNGITSLAGTRTDIGNFFSALRTARDNQMAGKTGTGTGSLSVETARVEAMTLMYGNLGAFVKQYAATPLQAEPYFDVAAIRYSQQTLFTGSIAPEMVSTVLKRKMKAADSLSLTNSSDALLRFYFTNELNTMPLPGQAVVELPPHSQQTADMANLGYTDEKRFLKVYNPSVASGTWQVEQN